MQILSGSLIYNVIKDLAKYRGEYVETKKENVKNRLEDHIIWAEGWSRHIQMFGMTRAVPVEQKSITLSISDRPRKFSNPDTNTENKDILTENDIIEKASNYIILGDPGCGKTTLCKRLTRNFILSEPRQPVECIEAPLVVLGRDLHASFTLTSKLAGILGNDFKPFDEARHRVELQTVDDREEYNRRIRSLRDSWNENVQGEANSLLKRALSKGGFALLVDGLDEINSNYRGDFEQELADFIASCPQLKVLCTCRAGDWTRSVVTADLLAIDPLSNLELREIVEAWADKPDAFLAAIENVPYREVLDRPLFLTMLLIIFNQGYELPDCPVDVYDRITTLLIERWDRERDIHRESRFSSFLSEKKLRFLSALAYSLTFEHNRKRFALAELQKVYEVLSERFKLPDNQFLEVLQEVESHTGILVEAGFGHYEFCHLTVQEYLAAKHLVGLATTSKGLALLQKSPATLAVATSVSAEPSNFLASILEEFCDEQSRVVRRNADTSIRNFLAYISRIRLELPEFSPNNDLAVAILRLWGLCDHLDRLGDRNCNELKSAAIALSRFAAIQGSIKNIISRPGAIQSSSTEDVYVIRTMRKDYRFSKSFVAAMG